MEASVPEVRRGLGARIAALGGGASIAPLLILFGLNAVDELDRTAFSVLLPEIRDHFGLNLTGVTALQAAVIPVGLVLALPIARLGDRGRRIPIAIAGAATWGLFSIFTGLATTVVLLGIARVGAGLGRAVNSPIHSSLLSDYYPPSARAKVISAHRAANTVGAFCGPLIAGFVAQAVGWRVPFFALSAPTFALVVVAMVALKNPEPTGSRLVEGRPNFRTAIGSLLGIRTLRRLVIAFPFLAFVAIGLQPLFALYYSDVFNVGPGARGVIQSFDTPFILLGLVVGSTLIDRGIAGDAGRAVRYFGLGALPIAVFILGAAWAPSLWIGIVCAYSIQVFATVLISGGVAIVSLVSPPESRASGFALFEIVALLGVIALPIVGRVGDSFGIRTGMAVTAPMLVVGALIAASAGRFANDDVRRIYPDHKPDAPSQPFDLTDTL
ncbi:MAG TPA: MFS transporter [Actinomycetota bacterium]|jgi:branched-chain amino acid transport system ATP-binding protein|nr:MFS transporter [Actinomycetota bacterium]